MNVTLLWTFSGSGTTAHAVMLQNVEDGKQRKFISIQLPEAIDKKDTAYKIGYKTIDEIGSERIIRAAKKIKKKILVQLQTSDSSTTPLRSQIEPHLISWRNLFLKIKVWSLPTIF